MEKLKDDNEAILREAREQRAQIISEAQELKNQIVSRAEKEASEKADQLINNAREEIQAEKMAALTEIKNQVGRLSIEIAEKIIRKELSDNAAQQEVVEGLVKDINLN